MTSEEFIKLNPVITDETQAGIKQSRIIQGEFLKTHTFIFDSLNDEMKRIIQLRYGLYDGECWKLEAIANKL